MKAANDDSKIQRVPEIIAPTRVCIAVRRVLGIRTRTIVRYPVGDKGWHYQLEDVVL